MPRGDGMQVSIAISKCESGKSYPVSIQDGMGCAGEMMQGKVWDAPRGAFISDVPCDGSGAPMTSNVVGRLLVMYDPADHEKPIICGDIHAPSIDRRRFSDLRRLPNRDGGREVW